VSSADVCEPQPKKLREYYCTNHLVQVKTLDCVDDCNEGVCVGGTVSTTTTSRTTTTIRKPCTDTDGGIVRETAGTAYSNAKSIADECISVKTLKEAYCRKGKVPSTKKFRCKRGCQDGACLV